ncbi:MAG TPA: thioesterase family protein [Myxococcota bacterium]
MASAVPDQPPAGATVSCVRHRVPFYETDAMAVVHHANYLRYFELARIVWLDEHDVSYRKVVEQGMHYATTKVEIAYHRAARFDDEIEIFTWIEWARGASLRMAYVLRCRGATLATGATEHAAVDLEGRVRRLPRERAERLRRLAQRLPDPAG